MYRPLTLPPAHEELPSIGLSPTQKENVFVPIDIPKAKATPVRVVYPRGQVAGFSPINPFPGRLLFSERSEVTAAAQPSDETPVTKNSKRPNDESTVTTSFEPLARESESDFSDPSSFGPHMHLFDAWSSDLAQALNSIV